MADWKELNKLSKEDLAKVPYNDPRLDSFAAAVEERYGLPKGIVESVKNAGEKSQSTQKSSKGAQGVMQFIDSTRKAYPHDPLDPMASIDAAGRYLSDTVKRYKGNAMAAIAEYNGGTAQAKLVIAGKDPSVKETKEYLTRIKSYMDSKYGGKK